MPSCQAQTDDPPALDLSIYPGQTLRAGQEVLFDASGTTDDGTYPVHTRFSWDFGDGFSSIDNAGIALTHIYAFPGVYTLTLSATDPSGNTSNLQREITVVGDSIIVGPRIDKSPIIGLHFDGNLDTEGSATSTASWQNGQGSFSTGILGQALLLDGNAYVKVDISNVSADNQLTVSYWLREHPTEAPEQFIFDYMETDQSHLIRAKDSGFLSIFLKSGQTGALASNTGNWHHYAIVGNGQEWKTYIDGKDHTMDRQPESPSIHISDGTLYIGYWYGKGDHLAGEIDEFMIFDEALSVDDIFGTFEFRHTGFNYHTRQWIKLHTPRIYSADSSYSLKVTLSNTATYNEVLLDTGSINQVERILIDYTTMPQGDYTLRAEIYDSDTLIESISESFHKVFDGAPRVAIDENNSLVVDGELFFPVTAFCMDTDEMETGWDNAADATPYYINSDVGTGFNFTSRTPADLDRFMHEAQGNLSFFGPSYWYGQSEFTDQWGRTICNRRNMSLQNLRNYLAAKDDFAEDLIAWAWGDEPDLGGVDDPGYAPSQVVRSWTYQTHLMDQERPVYTNLCGYQRSDRAQEFNRNRQLEYSFPYNAVNYGQIAQPLKGINIADIYSFDFYPFDWAYPNPRESTIVEYTSIIDNFRKEMDDSVPIMTYIEVTDINEYEYSSVSYSYDPMLPQDEIDAIVAAGEADVATREIELNARYGEDYVNYSVREGINEETGIWQKRVTFDIVPTPWHPSPEQVRMLSWLSVARGVKGISWFHYHTRPPAENFEAMKEFKHQIEELAPIILGPKPSAELAISHNREDLNLNFMLRQHEGVTYLIAVRADEIDGRGVSIGETENVEIHVAGLSGSRQVIPFEEYRELRMEDGVMTDRFEPNAVHIYQIQEVGTELEIPVDPDSIIIIDHECVDASLIPDEWIAEVKKMLINIPGESHGTAYLYGLQLLADMDSRYAVELDWSGPPSPPTDDHLRVLRSYQLENESWSGSCGEEDFWTNQSAISTMTDHLTYLQDNGNPITALGFGWCWDMTWHNPPGGEIDPEYGVHWAGSSVGGPDGDIRWGIDDGDNILTGNTINLSNYLAAVDHYNQQAPSTLSFFTTGPVDGNHGNENAYQRHLKHEAIRNHVKSNGGVLLDYADILSWSTDGVQYTDSWNNHDFPNGNLELATGGSGFDGGYGGCHVSREACLRLGNSIWWMLARIAGWDGKNASNTGLSVPRRLYTNEVSGTSFCIHWDDTSSNETGFLIEYASTQNFSDALSIEAAANTTAAIIDNLEKETRYYVRIRSIGTAGSTSGWSSSTSVETTDGIILTELKELKAYRDFLLLTFSQPVDLETVTDISNYSISGNTPTDISLSSNKRFVRVDFAHTNDGEYTLQISNILDAEARPIPDITRNYTLIDLSPGLQLHYTFDEMQGNMVSDSSGNNLDAPLIGGTWKTGMANGAVFFDGDDDYLQPPAGLAFTNMTYSVWVKTDPTNTATFGGYRGLFALADGAYTAFHPDIGLVYQSHNADGSAKRLTFANLQPLTDEWTLFTIVQTVSGNSYTASVYRNGELCGSQSDENGCAASDISYIGVRNQYLQLDFYGLMDDIRIYNRALNAEEVLALYNNPPSAIPGFAALAWPTLPQEERIQAIQSYDYNPRIICMDQSTELRFRLFESTALDHLPFGGDIPIRYTIFTSEDLLNWVELDSFESATNGDFPSWQIDRENGEVCFGGARAASGRCFFKVSIAEPDK